MPAQSTTLAPAVTADVAAEARIALETQLRELQEQSAALAPTAAPHIDPVAYATKASNDRVVVQIEAALARLDAGTYGSCTACGSAISAGRLEVVPHATACIECQSKAEHAR